MSVNKVILIGNVGKDPDVRYFDNGSAVVNFTLATTERGYTAANGTQIPDRTEWHNIVCWRGLAKVAEQFVRKGTQVYIEGKIRSRSYDDQNGVKRYVTEIYADNLELLGRRGDTTTQQPIAQPAYGNETASPSAVSTPKPVQQSTEPFGGDDSDDLPF
ncbi:single-strand DNA-binding protein [Dysgonomonas sp. PH5-45]|uniref:single-stranded DNA-binding protein n=1 Tax=unclassified Dysgonomonas TaxID=2630389 RepID=UPI002473DF8F|nr:MULTISPECIES: single-stranded DNA-binding protein [unclassified Dysgonomonas]MDH6355393.1 single-strand DNA-binding protein [Dysgonomonas sp. PH5-45]MDH6388291.1 single-strand DNA-binding protein [Dysgonomonas sp. PH5-37]